MDRRVAAVRPLLGLTVAAQGPGFGFGGQEEVELVTQFDKNGDKRLDAVSGRPHERRWTQGGGGGFGRRPFFGGAGAGVAPPFREEADAGGRSRVWRRTALRPRDAPHGLPAVRVQRLGAELEDFKNTDVEVPATMIVDGRTYKDVGVHFRGASSFMMMPAGYKRSLNLSLDFVHEAQQLGGFHTLNLLNAASDPTFSAPCSTRRSRSSTSRRRG